MKQLENFLYGPGFSAIWELTIMFLIIISLFAKIAVLRFKVSYYETTLKNRKQIFSPERWNHILKVMNIKNIWGVIKIK